MRTLEPVVKGADLTSLTDERIDSLARETAIDRKQLHLITRAARMADQAARCRPKVGSRARSAPQAELFYGLLRQDALQTPITRSTEELEAAVKRSVETGIIAPVGKSPASLRADVEYARNIGLLERAPEGSASLGDMLGTIPGNERPSEEEKLNFAGLYATHGNTDEMWKAVEASGLRSKLTALRRTLALQQLTGSNLPLIAALQRRRGARNAESTAYLAAVSAKEWRDLVTAKGAPEGVPPSVYAERLQTEVERAHPAAALLARLKRNDVRIRNFPKSEVKRFLAGHTDFDFRTQPVDLYLDEKRIKSKPLRQALKHISRVLTVTEGRIDAAAAIVDAGLKNSHQIALAGPEKVKALLSETLSEDTINRIAKKATDRTMKAIALGSAKLGRGFNVGTGETSVPVVDATQAKGLTLRSLFGSMDFCECRHCRSVLGPAAYFADLMHFLDTLPISNRAGKTALDGILARRPDLQHLELSCENTTTEIPYIDLVLEVLENAVALPLPIVLLRALGPGGGRGTGVITLGVPSIGTPSPPPAAIAAQLQEGKGLVFKDLPEQVQEALRRTAITLGDTFNVERTAHDTRSHESIWAVSDGSRRWEIQHRVEHLRVWDDLPGGAQTRDLPDLGAAFAKIKAQFQNGHLSQSLIEALTPEDRFPVKTVSNIVPALLPTLAWGGKATIIREIALELFPGHPYGGIKFFDYSGVLIAESPLDSNLFPDLVAWLRGNSDVSAKRTRSVIGNIGLPVDLMGRASVRSIGGRYVISLSQAFLFDLVGEQLSVIALAYQDSSILTNLAALPENRNPRAYAILRDTEFPWTLPFDLPLEEARAYLAELGIARRALIEMMTLPAEENDALAAEILGLSEREWNLIAPPGGTTPSLAAQWGVHPQNNLFYDEHLGSYRSGAMLALLCWVSVVMQQSRLSYRELLEVLQTVSPSIRPRIKPENECEPSKLQFMGGSLESALFWIHRFVRLWRRIGWTKRGLDRALAVFQRRIESPATLRGLALMQLLCEQLGASPLVVAGILGKLETQTWTPYEPEGATAEPSLYHKLFQQNALRASQSFPLFKLKPNGTLSATNSDTLSGHAEFIATALGITTADVFALSNGPGKVVAADTLTFENVELLYAVTTFARLLGLSITDYLRWQRLLVPTSSPFAVKGAARAKALLAFRDDILFARTRGQDLDELEYLLLDQRVNDFATAQKEIEDGARDIRSALLAGDVLAETANENLRTQLLRAGAPREFVSALESRDSLAQYLWAEITFDWTNANPPPAVPPELSDRFDWTYDVDIKQVRFSCRGFIEAAAFDQVPLPTQRRTQLRRRYELIRDIVASQIERVAPRDNVGTPFPAPWFSFTFPTPAPAFSPGSLPVPMDFGSFLAYDAVQGRLALSGFITQSQGASLKAALDSRLAPGIDDFVVQSNRVNTSWIERALALDLMRDSEDADIVARVLRRTAPLLEGSLLAERVAAFSGIDQHLCDALLDRIRVSTASRTARSALFDDAFLASTGAISATANAAQIEALARLKKAALLLKSVPLTAGQTAWLFGHAFSVLDVNALPVSAGTAHASYADWRAWRELLVLAQSMKDGFAVLHKLGESLVASAGQPNALFREACEITDVQDVADAVRVLNMTWPDHFRNPARLLKLVTLLNLMRMLGCKAALLKQLSLFSPSDVDAMSARKLFMAQFDSNTLPKRMEPVSNKLRTRQREALIDYLRARDRLRGPDDLLDYYLIDVEMDTCMRTSRIKQAISSVQLYVQRCLLGLERINALWPVAPHQINTQRWNWMKNYRVWEANRKVFLFAENWIEPELRDDKTELFRKLEAELLQEDLVHAKALEAFGRYIEDVSGLAKLTVLDLELESVGDDYIVHFVAVDQGKPRNVYYRSLRLKQAIQNRTALHWTPWEKVDGDIGSDHVVIFKVGPFLHIGYPVLSSDDDTSSQKVGFAVRRKTRDGWTGVKQSAGFLRMAIQPNKSPSSTLVLSKLPSDSAVSGLPFDPTNPIARIYLHAPSRLEFLVAQTINAPYEQLTPGNKLEVLTLRIRVLERFVDNLGNSFLRKTSLGLELEFKVDKDGDSAGPSSHVISTTEKFEFGPADVTYLNTTPQIPQEPGKWWCNSIKITATGITGHHTKDKIILSVSNNSGDIGASGEWITDIVFDVKPEISSEVLFPVDRNLDPQLIPLGHFGISKDFAISVGDTFLARIPFGFRFLADTERFGPGFLRTAPKPTETPLGSALSTGLGEILAQTQGRYFVVRPHSNASDMFSYRDDRHALMILLTQDRNQNYDLKYRVMSLGPDWALDNGVAALAALPRNLDLQALSVQENTSPSSLSLGTSASRPGSTVELVPVFDPTFPASAYDWETFFHAPLLIATQLSQAQRFEEARRWFHTIFDPTSNQPVDPNLTAAQWEAVRPWRFPPFRTAALNGLEIDDLLEAYARGELPQAERDELEANIEAWKDSPFNPHLIARYRKRSYMWAVVIKYIQNLIAWGDQLFRRDTMESINEATQLYVLAARILGPRPQSAPRKETRPRTYAEISKLDMDKLTNVWSEWEDGQETDRALASPHENLKAAYEPSSEAVALETLGSLYFCIPHNAGLTALWNIVEERLFYIRHCRNIEGTERKLPLFEPPIDPALLVRAGAHGLDIGAVLADLGGPLPLHRFASMLPKAMEICADLRALGAAVLQALEKKDAEELVLLRNTHEMALLKLTEKVKQRQIEEAEMTLQGIEENRRTAEERYNYYQKLLGRSDIPAPKKDEIASLAPNLTTLAKSGLDGLPQGLGISQTESAQLRLLRLGQRKSLESGAASTAAGVLLAIGGILSALPRGTSPGPQLGDMGGPLTGAGHSLNATASFLNTLSGLATSEAGMQAIVAGYERRRDDWIFQSNMALREMVQIDKQSAAAKIRKEIAEKELANTRAQFENAQSIDDFLKSKYSSAQLYRYMSNKLVGLYFRTYQLAIEVAKRAERCFQFELGQPSASFIQPSYWDNAKKGLLSGEQLHLDLRRMDLAYLESHKREYEITKHVSLMQIDPQALIALRQTGRCEFDIPEVFYDLDCPGHYMRRIKSVSLTIPCVTGPYSGVHCTLTLLSNSVRKDAGGQNYEKLVDDSRFIDDFSSIQSIVTSGAQADAGVFETNLREERYLPFEGAGAISTWRLELPSEIRQFDYDTIADVILHVRYTAREGGDQLKQSAATYARSHIARGAPVRLFSVRHEFPSEWAKFRSGKDLNIDIKPEHYPFWTRGTGSNTARGPSLINGARNVSLLAASRGGTQPAQIVATTRGTNNVSWDARLIRDKSMADLLIGKFKKPQEVTTASELKPVGMWNIQFSNRSIEDLWILVDWSASTAS